MQQQEGIENEYGVFYRALSYGICGRDFNPEQDASSITGISDGVLVYYALKSSESLRGSRVTSPGTRCTVLVVLYGLGNVAL